MFMVPQIVLTHKLENISFLRNNTINPSARNNKEKRFIPLGEKVILYTVVANTQ